ncbi:MAG: tetratricopeptide repeat protein, partial [Planctomycetes bacterium]|nr:tetratricopeptide repeat protein [Planctomycetota bacterium]
IGKRIDEIDSDSTLSEDEKLEQRIALLDAFVDSCHAVSYAHSKDVLHRDIKPENIMLGKYGETFVVDWGLAKVRGESERIDQIIRESGTVKVEDIGPAHLTQAGAIFGTPAYLAPEQARGDHERISELSDVFSLGAILFEIVSGQPPIDGETLRRTIFRAASCEHDKLLDVCPNAPPELVAIVEKAMAKNPADRFQNANEIAHEVNEWRAGRQVSIYDYSSMQLLKRFVKRNAKVLVAACLIIALTLGFIGFNLYQSHTEFQEALEARNAELATNLSALNQHDYAAYLKDAASAINELEATQAAYDATTPVVIDEANATSGVTADKLLAASALLDRRIELAEEPLLDQVHRFLETSELKQMREDSKALRLAASKLKALRGGWDFAAEIAHATPTSSEEQRAAQDYVQAQRELLRTMQRRRIEFVLNDLKEGLGRGSRAQDAPTIEQYTFELVGYRNQQTLDLLGNVLDAFAERLKDHRDAFEATPLGQDFVAQRLEKWKRDQRAIKKELPASEAECLEKAAEEDIKYPKYRWTSEERDQFIFATRVLGNLGLGDAAVAALEPISKVVLDLNLSLEVARALKNTAVQAAWEPILAMRYRYTSAGLSNAIWALMKKLPNPALKPLSEDFDLRERSNRLSHWGDREAASQDALEILKDKPNDYFALNLMGRYHAEQEEYELALSYFAKVVEHYPEWVWVYQNRSEVYQALENYPKALEEAEKAIALDPEDAFGHYRKSQVLMAEKRFTDALLVLDEAIRIDPEYAYAYAERGICYAELTQPRKTLQAFKRAIELDNQRADYFYLRSQAYKVLGEVKAELDDLSRALELDPSYRIAYYARASARASEGDFEAALADINRATELGGEGNMGALYFAYRGYVYFSMGEREKAFADWRIAEKIDPDHTETYVRRSTAHIDAGELDLAFQQLNLACEKDGDRVVALVLRAQFYRRQKNFSKSEEDLLEALKREPTNGIIHIELGMTLSAQGKNDEAILYHKKATELLTRASSRALAYNGLAVIYAAEGDREAASEAFKAAVELDPANIHYLKNYAANLVSLDRKDETPQVFEFAL